MEVGRVAEVEGFDPSEAVFVLIGDDELLTSWADGLP
jgi:hypothetical protein